MVIFLIGRDGSHGGAKCCIAASQPQDPELELLSLQSFVCSAHVTVGFFHVYHFLLTLQSH